MTIRFAILLITFAAVLSGGSEVLSQDLPNQGKLERVVILSRHGVRAPTQTIETLNSWRQQPPIPPWPDFGVPAGYLTPKGEQLVEKMGEYYRAYLDQNGIFDPAHCPDGVLIRADGDERTVMTAQGLGSGLSKAATPALSCRFAVEQAAEKPDPLFHPSEAMRHSCPLDAKEVETAVGTPAQLGEFAARYQTQLGTEQDILQCCGSAKLCTDSCKGLDDQNCTLQTLPSCADAAKGQASIKGGLGVAQSFAEILLLQYAQEFRGEEFGFGKADKEKMLDILRLHTAVFDKVQRAKYVAGRQGANLLYHIVYALKNGRDPGSPGGPYKLVAYVGHDTNIANLAALLDLHWQLPEYPQDDMPPGGALVFELRQGPNQPPSVDAFFAAQSPDAMRESTGAAPDRVPVKTPHCAQAGGPCPLEAFVVPLAQFIAMTTPTLEQNRGCLTD